MTPEDLVGELTAIWQEAMLDPTITRASSFLDLGGKSSQGVRLLSETKRRTAYTTDLEYLFQHPTRDQLASVLSADD